MRSAHPPERLAIELQSRVGAVLSHSGYRIVGQGPAGITWRRDLSGRVLAGFVILVLLALGGIASGDAGSIVVGLLCAAGAAVLAYFRRPAGVMIAFARGSEWTEISISGGPDAPKVRQIAMVVAGASQAAAQDRPSAGPGTRSELADPIARLVLEAERRSVQIGEAIERSGLPYEDVRAEVQGFVVVIGRAARRAQLLHEALEDTPPAQIAERLAEARGHQGRTDLAEALARQLETVERMETQLESFYAELERLLVELDTVRSELISVSASSEVAGQERLADEVRALRDCMSAVAEAVADTAAR